MKLQNPVAVFPDLYQIKIPTPFPVGPVNVYVARDPQGGGLTLVDCGPRMPGARQALETGLAAIGSCVRDVRRILVTHAHTDHYGLAASLAAESGAQVFTHPFNRHTLEAYDRERDRRTAFYADLLRASGVPEETRRAIENEQRGIGDYAESIPVAGELIDGDLLTLAGREWQVLHTPGHSGGLICLYEPQTRTLLSNDHLLRDISSNPLVEPPPPGCTRRFKSLVEYIGQMRRVAAMPISIAWPGHGEPIHDVRDLVHRRVEFHARRAGRILELVGGDPLTTYQVTRAVFPRLEPISFFLAISEVVGHLELLESEGRLRSTQRDDGVKWEITTPGV